MPSGYPGSSSVWVPEPVPYEFFALAAEFLPRLMLEQIKFSRSGCWLWQGQLDAHGYGTHSHKRAHRLAYQTLIGPVPEGLHLDHLCRVRHCLCPTHLEPVSPAENARRGVSPSALNYGKTHCAHGHEFTAENTYVRTSSRGTERGCKECRRQNVRKHRALARETANG